MFSLLSVGGEVRDQTDDVARFAAIVYDDKVKQFVFSARKWHNETFSYICQQYRSTIAIYNHFQLYSISVPLSSYIIPTFYYRKRLIFSLNSSGTAMLLWKWAPLILRNRYIKCLDFLLPLYFKTKSCIHIWSSYLHRLSESRVTVLIYHKTTRFQR